MTDEKLSQMLQQALSSDVPGEQLNRDIKSKMEEKEMKKHFNMKKVFIMAAACCLLVGTVSVASQGAVSYILSSGGTDIYKDFEQLEQAEKKAGFQVKAKESFESGYLFKEVRVGETRGATIWIVSPRISQSAVWINTTLMQIPFANSLKIRLPSRLSGMIWRL